MQILSAAIILFGIGTAVFFTVQSNREKKEKNELNNRQFLRNTFLDLLGLALVMDLAMWLGRAAADIPEQDRGYSREFWLVWQLDSASAFWCKSAGGESRSR